MVYNMKIRASHIGKGSNKMANSKRLSWVFDTDSQILSVDENCKDYEQIGMLSFALIRYKDVTTHEEFLTVKSLYNTEDNGQIDTSIEDFGKDLPKLRKYGVVLNNVQLADLKKQIELLYLDLDIVYVNIKSPYISDEELSGLIGMIQDSLVGAEYLVENNKCYMPVKDFGELLEDSELDPLVVRKVLLEKGYIEGSNGRTAILKRLDKKTTRVLAFYADKFGLGDV